MSPDVAARDHTSAAAIVCPVCDSVEIEVFVEVLGLPAHVGVLWGDAEAARNCQRGDIRLAWCECCGHVSNAAFDPENVDYTQDYDNSLHASAVFRTFEAGLVQRLARPDLRHELAVEIGPGDGRFLSLLAEVTPCRGIGFEPGLSSPTVELAGGSVELRNAPFSAAAVAGNVRLLCCRQVLEHIDRPHALLREVHRLLARSKGSRAYFEVPNAEMLLVELSIWDLMYEHCQYFVDDSLSFLFEAEGFEILERETSYEGQFLGIEVSSARSTARRAPRPPERLSNLLTSVHQFGTAYAKKSAWWQDYLAGLAGAGKRTVLWGAGGRAATFAHIAARHGGIDCAIDINEAKQGTYLAGTGHEIRPPESLRQAPPDVVVVVNPIYVDEIGAHLAAMGLDPEVVAA